VKSALLIIDMQKVFMDSHQDRAELGSVVEHINHVAKIFRDAGHPVVFTKDIEGMTEENAASYEIIDALPVAGSDRVVDKLNTNGFWETGLHELLKSENVGFVVVAGYSAEHCVTFTWQGARERGYRACMLQDGVLAYRPEALSSLFRSRNFVSYPALEHFLGNGVSHG
jgi:nicotinamidase-related amidase